MHGEKEFFEISPRAVKKEITGNGTASKEEVAQCLKFYVGEQHYACDDESDAVAVGVAWLLQQGLIDSK